MGERRFQRQRPFHRFRCRLSSRTARSQGNENRFLGSTLPDGNRTSRDSLSASPSVRLHPLGVERTQATIRTDLPETVEVPVLPCQPLRHDSEKLPHVLRHSRRRVRRRYPHDSIFDGAFHSGHDPQGLHKTGTIAASRFDFTDRVLPLFRVPIISLDPTFCA